MKQQIIVSGIGGQGVIFVTRILAEAAIEMGMDVLTSETHGMAIRGGTVISHVKIGPFTSPLIRSGRADIGLFLLAGNLDIHQGFLKPGGKIYMNAQKGKDGESIDATRLAREQGAPVVANLIFLGFAARQGGLFCGAETIEAVLRMISPAKQLETNLTGFRQGLFFNEDKI
ncbi:MAG TPA: 2-oxoacid:acceptor oxidoreductase family protein [Syntrophales bacterium]|nr:2-oxoacid:acceptor oxidoreductase family protein [Syntrophales bacterium]